MSQQKCNKGRRFSRFSHPLCGRKNKPDFQVIAAAAVMASTFGAAHFASAGIIATWSGGTSGSWSDSTNWNAGAGPVPGTGDTADFSGPSSNVTTTGTGLLNTLNFDGSVAYTIGTALTFDAGGQINVASTDTANQAVGAETYAGNETVTNNSTTAGLTIGAPALAASAVMTLGGAGNITESAGPSTSNSNQQLVWSATGSNTLTLTGSQTGYNGGVTFNGGTVMGNNANSFSSKAVTLSNTTAELTLTSSPTTSYTAVTINNSSTIDFNASTGTLIWTMGNSAGTSNLTSPNNNNPTLTFTAPVGLSSIFAQYLNMTSFAGTINIGNDATFRLRGANSLLGSALSAFTLNTGGTTGGKLEVLGGPLANSNGTPIDVNLGSLAGNQSGAIVRGAQSAASSGSIGTEYSVGALGTSTTYAGLIKDGLSNASSPTTSGFTALKVVGGTLNLTNTGSTYQGGTTVTNGGTLGIAGDGSLGAAYTGSLVPFTYIANGATAVTGYTIAAPPSGTTAAGSVSTGVVTLSNAGTGYVSNPTVTVVGTGGTPASTVRAVGLLTLDNGTLITNGATTSNRAVVLGPGGGTINTNGVNDTFSGVFNNGSSGSGGLTVTDPTGLGSLSLTGNDTYAGPTAVNSGDLLVLGSILNSATTIAGGTLGGTGSTGSISLTTGTLAPGVGGPGILNTGNLTTTGGTLAIDLDGPTVGTGYDELNVTGTVSLANTNLVLNNPGFTPTLGETFTIVNNDGVDAVTGTFANGSTINDSASYHYSINYAGGDGNDIVLTVVPEPMSISMLGMAAIGTLARRRRVNRK